jgi:protein O-GlcNAc transferase
MPNTGHAIRFFESGSALMQQGLYSEALRAFQDAVHANPGLAQAWYNMGVIQQSSAKLPTAVEHYRKALALNNDFKAAHFNLAHALDELGRFEEAVQAYSHVLRKDPSNARAAYNLAALFASRGRMDEAVRFYEQAIRIVPDYAAALNNLGVIRRDQDRLEEARKLFDQALALDPRMPEALYNVGVCLQKSGDYAGGIEYYRQALEANAAYSPARWLHDLSLPMLYDRTDDIDTARRRFSRNLARLTTETPLDTPAERRRALSGIACSTNFLLQYQGEDDCELQKLYGHFVARVMKANFPRFSQKPVMPPVLTTERIRIGYVSSLMRSHTVGIFLRGWLEGHDRSRFEIFGYHVGSKSDAETERIAAHLDHFHALGPDLAYAADRIAADRLHVLIHTDVGMDPITLQLAGLNLAPVQCKGWGHPVTTGLPTIDYYLSSNAMETEDAGQYYSETLIRLPGLALKYTPPALPAAPVSRRDLSLPEKAFIFLSTQSLFKYLPQFDAIYPAIAARVPQACFVFIEHSALQVTQRFRDRLGRAFAAAGLSADTFCRIVPRQNHAGFLSLNMAADVLLDTFAWSGGKTTLEAIACGLPVVTCPGRFMRGRHAYAMLKIMQIPQTIARDMNEYCAIAARLAQDSSFYARMRAAVTEERGRLFEDQRFMIALEDFLVQKVMVQSVPAAKAAPSQRQRCDSLFAAGRQHHAQGRLEAAIADYRAALAECAGIAELHYHLGRAYHQTGQLPAAVASYRKTLELAPEHGETHFNLAHVQEALGQVDDAEALYRRLLEYTPADERVPYNLGTSLLERGRPAEALDMLDRAVRLAPNSAPARNNLGKALLALERPEEALDFFRKAVEFDPLFAAGYFNMAECLAGLGLTDEAVAAYRKALAIDPQMGAALNNLGNLYRRVNAYDQAAQCYRRLLELSPDLAEAHYNLGSLLRDTDAYGPALKHLSHAVKLRPDYAEAWNNLALTFKNIGDLERALTCFNRAIEQAPDLAVAHWNRSFVHLLKEDYLSGWNDFEWRFRMPEWKFIYPFRLTGKRWHGGHAPEATILVHDEQGLGDTLQFARYLPWVKKRCKTVILETRSELLPLFQGFQGVDRLVARPNEGGPSCAYDYHIPLMSLPGIFGTTAATVPWSSPYIAADPRKGAEWQNRLPKAALTIGLVWAGRPEHRNDRNRSCRLLDFEPLRQFSDIALISLQKGPAAEQISGSWAAGRIVDIGSTLSDFADTAGVLAHLDLLITVDTAVAHLAGAMGKAVWILIPFIADWRWGMQRNTTSWYPSVRLFRQTERREWGPVIERIIHKLRLSFETGNPSTVCAASPVKET